MTEISKKPTDVIKKAITGGMTPGIVTPDEAIAIGNAMVADDGKVDARGAMLMFRHLHDLHSKTEFVLDEDRARLSDIAKLGIKQLFERQHNGLLCTKPGEKAACVGKDYSLIGESFSSQGGRASFAFLARESQRYYLVMLNSKSGEYLDVGLSLESGAIVYDAVSIDDMRWFHNYVFPMQKADIIKDAAQREKLVAIVDVLEKGIYAKGIRTKKRVKLKGYSKPVKLANQRKLAYKYFKSIAKRTPYTTFKVRGVTIRLRGELVRGMREAIQEAFEAFHPNELKAIGSLNFNIFDKSKLKRFIKSKFDRKAHYAYSIPDGFALPGGVFLSVHSYKKIMILRHEMGHNLDYIYGGKGLFSTKEFWGIAHHYRTYILPCKDRACLVDRALNLYAGDANRYSSKIAPEPEWFTESRRLIMSNEGYAGPDQFGFSTIEELKRKDPVGFLVFAKYRQLLDDNHKRPQDAFSMTSFHEARKLVASSGGEITDKLLKKWSKLALNLQAERYVKRGMALMKKGKKERPAAIKEFRKALALIPEYSYARSQLAKVLRDDGRHGESVRECEVLFEKDPFLGGENVGFLIKYYKKHAEHKKLLALYNKRLAQQPDWAEYHNLKANLLVKMGRVAEAYDHLEAQAKRTGKIDYLIAIAKIANRKRDYKKVSWVFGKLKKLEGQLTQNCADGYRYIGDLIYHSKVDGRYKEALWWYRRGMEKYPADLLLNFYYAYTSVVNLKMKGVSKDIFRKAMAYFEKQDAKALYKRAKAHGVNIVPFANELIENKQYKHATMILSKLINVRPRDISLRTSYAKALHGAGQKSLFDKELAHINGPDFDKYGQTFWLVEVARFTAKGGDKPTTIALLDKVIAIDKGWGSAEYAAYHLNQNEEKAALQHLDKLRIAIAKGEYRATPEVYGRIGNIFYRSGRRSLALPWYESGVREHPHDFSLNYWYAWTALIDRPSKSVDKDLLNQAMGYLTTLDAKTSLKNHKRIEEFVRQLARKGLKQHVWAFCENVNSKKRIPFIKKAIADSSSYRADATLYRAWLSYEPNSVAAHLGLSQTFVKMGKHRDVLKVLDTWNDDYLLHPDISAAKAKLASRVKLDAHYRKAIAELEEMEASRSDITLTAAHYRLIANYYHKTKGDKQMAMDWYVHGIKRYPKDYKLHWKSAELAMDSRDEQWLQQEIQILNELNPSRYVSAEFQIWSSYWGNEFQGWEMKRELRAVYIDRK